MATRERREVDRGAGPHRDRIRKLQVFAFDPTRGQTFGNHLTLRLPWERLRPGPVGRYVAVVDRDKTHQRTYPPLDLESRAHAGRGGLAVSELDLQFHQQMAYAVTMHTIDLFERALGRRVVWRWARGRRGNESRLRIYPHAEEVPNAWIDVDAGEMYLGYTAAAPEAPGANLPGQIVYTCLSYDVIVHETVHALLASLFTHPTDDSGADPLALPEALCDLIALFQHFDVEEAVLETIRRTNGFIHRRDFSPDIEPAARAGAVIQAEVGGKNPLLEISRQFGEAVGLASAIRTALGSAPDPKALETTLEPHERGAILVAAIFDAFLSVYTKRTADLRRLAGAPRLAGDLHPDLARRMTREASKTARHFCNMCIRALDYCPPVAVDFGDYLRALITADYELVPDDPWGYRAAIIQAFRARGIRPDGAASYSEEALLWPAPEWPAGLEEPRCEMPGGSRAKQERAVRAFVLRHRRRLGLGAAGTPHFVHGVARRSQKRGPSGTLQRELFVSVTQSRRVSAHDRFVFRGGAKLVIDADRRVRYVIDKPFASRTRLAAERAYRRAAADGKVAKPTRTPARRADPVRTRRRLFPAVERVLEVYAFDPSRGRAIGNRIDLRVPFEPLDPGPVGRKLAVIDYDPAHGTYYPALDLDDVWTGDTGLAASETDPRFHQQMVYAIASETIARFEFALGRPVRWRWDRAGREPLRRRLRIFPHALQEANAYYDRGLGALLFGYFPASEVDAGASLPGQMVFTCLSHDIIVHETTHAVLDGVQPLFLEPTSDDAVAFHEAFGDLVALFQHFSCKDALLEAIQRTGGRIHANQFAPELRPDARGASIQVELSADNPMVDLARQFGEAMGTRAALRSALGTPPGSRRLAALTEPHERGAVLVAAVFDAFFSVYVRRTRDLMRIARAGGISLDAGDLHPDLAARLAREAAKTARHFATICIRALDYCPPVDIRFGDFLRAVITSDADIVPDDPWAYRGAFIDAFRSRGIFPDDVVSFSEESLRWEPAPAESELACRGLRLDARSPKARKVNAIQLNRFGRENTAALGLSSNAAIQAFRFHSLASQRVDPEGRMRNEFLVHLLQQRTERLDPDVPDSAFKFRGGSTIIMDEKGAVRYVIGKSLDDPARLARQREFLGGVASGTPAAALLGPGVRDVFRNAMNLAAVHRGY